ncbi:MAG: 4Fe-4S dicluster domain-containing protein [Elusimicrobia bacterium]|nr:4Fe-4S dicluster domain-containing protein [Elusimicrobiota bacterium]
MPARKTAAPPPLRWPVTDAFGTRLDPRELLRGVAVEFDRDFKLRLDDEGAVFSVAAPDLAHPRLEHALSRLRDRLAGWSVRLQEGRARAGDKARVHDERRVPVLTVTLVEADSDAPDLAAARRILKKRLGAAAGGREPLFFEWRRAGNSRGFKPAVFIAASLEKRAIRWLEDQLAEFPVTPPAEFRVLLDGLERGILRRPTVAAEAPAGQGIVRDATRCRDCGTCAGICPAGRLSSGGKAKPGAKKDCLRCFDCVEACPEDALRPAYAFTSAMRGEAACDRPGWLSRLKGCAGPSVPSPFPPSYLLPKSGPVRKPRVILGLAISTPQEHAAALVRDGRVVGAVEEEKLSRVRHHGWPAPGSRRYGFTLEESFCRRSIRLLLSQEGLTLDDVDLIAINGLPPRYGMACAVLPPDSPLPVISAGRLMFIPHHLCHAASAFRASGQKEAWVLTVDGRGERRTAAVFHAGPKGIRPVYELLCLARRSIGGVCESVSRLLGFGAHGQGIVMALASSGDPVVPFGRWLSWKSPDSMAINEDLSRDLAALGRKEDGGLKPAHRDLAASLQKALEDTAFNILGRFVPLKPLGLCLAGGVALNCRMNRFIREKLKPRAMFVQPGANDAGTALGAALEALAFSAPKAKSWVMEDACLGPEFSEDEMKAALDEAGLACRRSDDPAAEAARILVDGKVLGWFQGRLEFGPTALGHRSILADPRRKGMKDRVNGLKKRHAWRPFGSSILAGREAEWFEDPLDSRFMLFSVPVRKDKAPSIPAVMQDDGAARPQSVHRKADPVFHRLLSEFDRRTGVPLVLNASFNRKGEPLVATPREAAVAFKEMGLDVLVMGPFIVEAGGRRARPHAERTGVERTGRRLSLRLTVDCDLDCPHCTIRDLKGAAPRSFEAAVAALERGRDAGCSELVLMRGEPTLWPRLAELCMKARAMGYGFIQAQTHARAFAGPGPRAGLLSAVDAAEVMLLGPDEAGHDALSGVPGSFLEALKGIKVLLGAGKAVLVTVPVLRRNLDRLEGIPVLLHKLGVRRVQFNFPRPVQLPEDAVLEPLARLSDAGRAVSCAARAAAGLGLAVSTEGLPYCHLDREFRPGAESARAWERFRADDLDGVRDGLGSQIAARPEPPVCRGCALRSSCPKTWTLYLEVFGSSELRPVAG